MEISLAYRNTRKEWTTKVCYCNEEDNASPFSPFFLDSLLQEACTFRTVEGNLKLKDRWKQLDIEDLKKIIATLPLIGVYKYGGEPIHQIWRKDDGRPTFNTILAQSKFREIYLC